MSLETRLSAAIARVAQEFVAREPLSGTLVLNGGSTVWDLDGAAFPGENTFFERVWDSFSSDSALITQNGNGIQLDASLAGRKALIGASMTADIAINNRLTGVMRVMNGATLVTLGASYVARNNANDEGTLFVIPRPYTVVGGETLTIEERYSQDGTSAAANPAIEGGCYFYVQILGGYA